MQEPPTQSQINQMIASQVFEQLGFQVASESNIPQILKKVKPRGGKHFRDALAQGCDLLSQLSELIKSTGTQMNWNFVHIVLTDGDDGGSESSLPTILQKLSSLDQHLQVKMHKLVLIGLEASQSADNQLKTISNAGGENAEQHSIHQVELKNLFQQIITSVGLERRKYEMKKQKQNRERQKDPCKMLQNFAFLLTIQISDWMSPEKWSGTCQVVEKLIGYLGDNDLIAASIFNHETKILTKISTKDSIFKASQKVNEKEDIKIIEKDKIKTSYIGKTQMIRSEQAPGKSSQPCPCQIM